MLAVMLAWKLHVYGNVPGEENVKENVCPGFSVPLSNAVPVTVCGMTSLFVHLTVVPALTVIGEGTNARFMIETCVTAAEDALPNSTADDENAEPAAIDDADDADDRIDPEDELAALEDGISMGRHAVGLPLTHIDNRPSSHVRGSQGGTGNGFFAACSPVLDDRWAGGFMGDPDDSRLRTHTFMLPAHRTLDPAGHFTRLVQRAGAFQKAYPYP